MPRSKLISTSLSYSDVRATVKADPTDYNEPIAIETKTTATQAPNPPIATATLNIEVTLDMVLSNAAFIDNVS